MLDTVLIFTFGYVIFNSAFLAVPSPVGFFLPVLFRLHNLDFVSGYDPSLLLRLATVAAHTLLACLVQIMTCFQVGA